MSLKGKVITFGILASLTIFLSLLLSAIHVVEINNFGLKYRTLDHSVTDIVSGSGRQFSGIATMFIQYPTTNIIFEFSNKKGADMPTMSAWTVNGQAIYIEISFFAKFITQTPALIKKFYFEFGENWKGYFVRMAYSRIKEVTTRFRELDFYQEREMINRNITAELSSLFLNQSFSVLNVTEVQLRKIELDNDLESAVEDKLIELQSQRKWQIQQNITMIVKETELIKQWAQNNITLIYANATSTATNVSMMAEANATKIEYEGYAEAYKILSQNVDMTNANAFLSFMFAETLSKYGKSANVNLGFTKPAVLVNQGP